MSIKHTACALLLTIMLIILPSKTAFAASEQILGFYSQITINTNASIDVSEQISVYANQEKIIRGIVRRFPTHYTDSYGVSHKTSYQIKSVLLNNSPIDYHISSSGDQLSLYIGSKSVTLPPGIYTYTINYHANNAVNFLKDADELYWNVTGNNWDFPIIKAQADITLPSAAKIGLYNGYTGITGAKNKNFAASLTSNNTITYQTTRVLEPGMGLTIAVSWQKSIVHQPTLMESLYHPMNFSEQMITIIMLISFVYYLLAWVKVGKDPDKGTIIPLFEPPDDISAAGMRYIMKMGSNLDLLPISIIALASKGYLQIKESNGEYTIIKSTPPQGSALTADETKTLSELFNSTNTLLLGLSDQSSMLKRANKMLVSILESKYENIYFHTNYLYLIPGALLGIAALAIAAFSSDKLPIAVFMMVWLFIWSIVCFTLVYTAFKAISNAIAIKSWSAIGSAVSTSFFSLPFIIGEMVGLAIISTVIPMLTIPLLALIVMMNVIFSILMKAPTQQGRKVMDQIEGFKLFLSTTERYRLKELNAPGTSPELFERYLPYAMALGVQNAWGQQFNESLLAAGKDPAQYHPTWYTSTTAAAITPAMLSAALSSGFSSAVNTASMPVSSSASGGGGGSSGGGGGGGGGGGW